MIQIRSIDVTRMGVVMNRYVQEFGFASNEVTQRQAGLLQKDLVDGMGPRNTAKAQRIASGDVRKVFSPDFKSPNIRGEHRQGAEMVWLAAGPKWIVGVNKSDFTPQASVEEMAKRYQAEHPSGKDKRPKFVVIGRRGKQSVQRLQRIVVGRGNLAQFIRLIRAKFGKLKASWCFGWDFLNGNRPKPAKWIYQHITNGTARGSVSINLHGERPTVTLISNGTGVESSQSLGAIKRAIVHRTNQMVGDLKQYSSGIKKRAGFSKN